MNSLLGVSLPVYKRPDQLRRCLVSVIEAARPHGVPVYILDDSGDDTNLETVAAARQAYAEIRHIRNPSTLGIDRNILNSVDACECRYVWLLGEDDRLTPDAVGTVLKILASEPAFVFVNYSTVNEEVTSVLREQALPLAADGRQDAAGFLASHGWAAGFIGGCVVNRELWRNAPQDPYIGTYFAHVGVIFHSLHGREVQWVAEPLVLNRCGTTAAFTWQSVTFEVLGGWARLMDGLRPLYGKEVCDQAVQSFERAHGLNSLKFLLYLRAGGAYDRRHFETYIRPARRGMVYTAAAWLVARGNRKLIHMAHRLVSRVRQQRGRRIAGY